jgi:hypothetical protein
LLVAAQNSRREHWLELVRAWKASGLSRSEYAAKAGVSPQTLGWYAWRLEADGETTRERSKPQRRGKLPKAVPRPTVVELAPGMPVVELTSMVPSHHRLELEIAGVTVRLPTGFDVVTLTRLLDVLEARR